jgi:hypothetical protein
VEAADAARSYQVKRGAGAASRCTFTEDAANQAQDCCRHAAPANDDDDVVDDDERV